MRKDTVTCLPDDQLNDVRERVQSAGQDLCIVVNNDNVVLGRLRGKAWDNDPDARAGDVMRLAAPTIRPDVFLHDVCGRFQRGKMSTILVTSYGSQNGGRLLGVLYREDVERTLAENDALLDDDVTPEVITDPVKLKISE